MRTFVPLKRRVRFAGAAAALLGVLAGCSSVPGTSGSGGAANRGQPPGSTQSAAGEGTAASAAGALQVPGHIGQPFDVAPSESLLTILAFRGGTLGKAGHNHVIASHDVSGTIYVPEDRARTSFELHVPVDSLTVDEPGLRAKEGPDFPTDVPDLAKQGTRRNMLGEALLNAAQFPEILLANDASTAAGSDSGGNAQVPVRMTVRGQTHTIAVPVTYALDSNALTISGEITLRQTDLGLTPFSALLGALQVQDEMRVRFRLVAHPARTRGASP